MNQKNLAAALSRPFEPHEVQWKPQTVQGNRALVVAFVDARLIQDRLDEVVGVMGWQDHYEPLPDGSVVCRLQIRVGEQWITKEDVGSPSEQPDEGDRRKAAFSDALKRAAVKFGIGRYLYRLKPQWVAYDPHKRRIVGTPELASLKHDGGSQIDWQAIQQVTDLEQLRQLYHSLRSTVPPADWPQLDRAMKIRATALKSAAQAAIQPSAPPSPLPPKAAAMASPNTANTQTDASPDPNVTVEI